MSDYIQDIIDRVLANIKVSIQADTKTSSSSYASEPILKKGKDLEEDKTKLPLTYKQMRQIEISYDDYHNYTARLFYAQAKFMENHEDDFPFTGVIYAYYPTYSVLDVNQLRGYFSWRTKVRKKIFEKSSQAFVFIYIYELINNIGVENPLDGYKKLVELWNAYKSFDARIDYEIRRLLKDYVLYYDLDLSLIPETEEKVDDDYVYMKKLLDFQNSSPKEIFISLNYFSNYNLLKSRFYKQYERDVERIVYQVFCDLTDYYYKHGKTPYFEKLFGRLNVSVYYLFGNAIFADWDKPQDQIITISDFERYFIQNGTWYHEYYARPTKPNKKIGLILKAIDYQMRLKYDFKYPIKEVKITKVSKRIIEKAIDTLLAAKHPTVDMFSEAMINVKKIPQVTPVVIDTTKLDTIRQEAEAIQQKLIIEEGYEMDLPEKQVEVVESISLSSIEIAILKAILAADMAKVNNLIKANGLMLAVVVDSINDKLFEKIQDTVLEINGNTPTIIEDYIDDLKELLSM